MTEIVPHISVALAIAGVFAILVNKICKIMTIFEQLDHLKYCHDFTKFFNKIAKTPAIADATLPHIFHYSRHCVVSKMQFLL